MNEWKPHPKQEVALMSTAFETLYGGARSGGKTDAGLAWLLYDIDNPLYRGLVIRKNTEDTKDWVDRARRMFSGNKAVFTGQPPVIEFPSGAKVYVGHLKDDSAYTKYQGHEYHRMLIEELTQIPSEDLYIKLISSCRSTVDGLKPMVFATCNPGGVGHFWVKRRFVDVARPMNTYIDPVSGRTRIYIPATVDDNPTILEKDPDYVGFLDSLPPDLKAQWRHGSWENVQFKGQIYGAALKQTTEEGRIYEFSLDKNRSVIPFFDIGLNDMMAIVFLQQVGQKNMIVGYHESNGNQWAFYAKLLKEFMKDHDVLIETVVLPHDGKKRGQDTLRSFKDVLEEEGFNVLVMNRTSDVLSDIQIVKQEFPMIHFHSTKAQRLLEAIDQYRFDFDEKYQVYKDQPKHDWTSHPCDALRLMCMWLSKGVKSNSGKDSSTDEAADYLKRLIAQSQN